MKQKYEAAIAMLNLLNDYSEVMPKGYINKLEQMVATLMCVTETLFMDCCHLYEHKGLVAAVQCYRNTTGKSLKDSKEQIDQWAKDNKWEKAKYAQ